MIFFYKFLLQDTVERIQKIGHNVLRINYYESSCVTAISKKSNNVIANADFRWDGGAIAGF